MSVFTNGMRAVTSAQSRSVPHYIKNRDIFSGDLFPTLALIRGGDKANGTVGPGQREMYVPGAGGIETIVTHQIEPKVSDHATLPTSFSATAAQSSISADTDTTVTLDKISGLTPRIKLVNRRTGAMIQVRSATGSTLTFRAMAGGANGDGRDAIEIGDKFDALSSSRADGSQIQSGLFVEPRERSNYVDFSALEVDMGDLASVRKLYPMEDNGNEVDMMIRARQMNELRERNAWFGVKGANTVGGELIYSAAGITRFTTVEYDVGGTMTMQGWYKTVSPIVFQAGGGSTKNAVCGNSPLAVLNMLADSRTSYNSNQKSLGNLVTELKGNGGTVRFMGSQAWHERDGEIFFYDPDLIKRFVFPGFDMALFTDMAPNDYFKSTSVWAVAECFIPKNPEHMVKLVGVFN